jgi:hypothetical protein
MSVDLPYISICPEGELFDFCNNESLPVSRYSIDEIKNMLLKLIDGDVKEYSAPEAYEISCLGRELEKTLHEKIAERGACA